MPDDGVLAPEMVEPLERHPLDEVVRVGQVDLAERRSHGAYLAAAPRGSQPGIRRPIRPSS